MQGESVPSDVWWTACVFALWLLGGGGVLGSEFAALAHASLGRVGAAAQQALRKESERWWGLRDRGVMPLLGVLGVIRGWFRAAPKAGKQRGAQMGSLPETLLVLDLVLLGAAAATNYGMLVDIVPDLLGLSPVARAGGLGWVLTFAVPGVIVLGEAIGGMLAPFSRAGLWIFLSTLGFELMAALLRAADIAFLGLAELDLFNQATQLTYAAAFVWLGICLPFLIFASSRALQPTLVGLEITASIQRACAHARTLLWNCMVGIVAAGAGIGLVIVWFGLGLMGTLFVGVQTVLRLAVFPTVELLIALGCDVPAHVLRRIADGARAMRWGPAQVFMAGLVLAVAMVLWATSTVAASQGEEEWPVVQAAELSAPIDPDEILEVSASRVGRWIAERVDIKRVTDPRLLICIADATGSIPARVRRAVATSCARLSAHQPAHVVVATLPVSSWGHASDLEIRWRGPGLLATRCVADPALPEMPSQTLLFDRRLARAREWVAKEVARCEAALRTERERTESSFAKASEAWIDDTVARLVKVTFGNTDLFGTLARCAELVKQAEKRVGASIRGVEIHIFSDLMDDVACENPHQDACDAQTVALAQSFLAQPYVEVLLHQVVLSQKKAVRSALEWRDFWMTLVPDAEVETWSERGYDLAAGRWGMQDG